MSTLELPKESKIVVGIAVGAIALALRDAAIRSDASVLYVLPAFLVSGFLADAITGLAHFCFDYVFPDSFPIFGPIAREFRQHHDDPRLDPSDYVENFTKGAFASLPMAGLAIWLARALPPGVMSFGSLSTLIGVSVWALFFHQIHSYAHMGSILPPEQLHARIAKIRQLTNHSDQVREFSKLFEAVPIPPVIRLLQRCRLILNPSNHNLHHVLFETDFSSVNGWSDTLLNFALEPIARRKKAMREAEGNTKSGSGY